MEPRTTSPEPPTERQLLELARATLESTLPDTWTIQIEGTTAAVDGMLRMTGPDGRVAVLPVEAKSILDARDVAAVRQQLRLGEDPDDAGGLVVARYLSPRARGALAEAGMSFVDATGNVRVTLADPAVFVLTEGANRDPWRSPDRPTSSLRGTPSARVVRALVDLRPPWKIRELAGAAVTSLGSTSRTVDFLARESLIERAAAGAIVDVDWPALLMRWAADYDLARKRRVRRLLAARGIESVEDGLRDAERPYVISGSPAAARWAPVAEPRLALVYTPDADELGARLGLRDAPTRPNVVLIEPEDDYVFARHVERDGLRVAAPSQVAVDLLAGPGRNPEEGQALIDWMRANETTWRGA